MRITPFVLATILAGAVASPAVFAQPDPTSAPEGISSVRVPPEAKNAGRTAAQIRDAKPFPMPRADVDAVRAQVRGVPGGDGAGTSSDGGGATDDYVPRR